MNEGEEELEPAAREGRRRGEVWAAGEWLAGCDGPEATEIGPEPREKIGPRERIGLALVQLLGMKLVPGLVGDECAQPKEEEPVRHRPIWRGAARHGPT
ncbi:hypothetical protein Droror1_Dr00023140 [Drosera rotundifolia]